MKVKIKRFKPECDFTNLRVIFFTKPPVVESSNPDSEDSDMSLYTKAIMCYKDRVNIHDETLDIRVPTALGDAAIMSHERWMVSGSSTAEMLIVDIDRETGKTIRSIMARGVRPLPFLGDLVDTKGSITLRFSCESYAMGKMIDKMAERIIGQYKMLLIWQEQKGC